jgi:purine-binding chemotaxis protein CheW
VDILTFELDGRPYAFRAESVVQVVQMVAISPLPGAPPIVEGVVNVRGTVVPVFDLRARFGLPSRPVDPAEHLVILAAATRPVAVRVDAAEDFLSISDSDIISPASLADSGIGGHTPRHVAGIAATDSGTTIIYDLAAFLSLSESAALDEALAPTGG